MARETTLGDYLRDPSVFPDGPTVCGQVRFIYNDWQMHAGNFWFDQIFFDARMEWMQAIGMRKKHDDFMPIVMASHNEFYTPLTYPNEFDVKMGVLSAGRHEVVLAAAIVIGDEVIASQQVRCAAWDAAEQKRKRFSDKQLKNLERYILQPGLPHQVLQYHEAKELATRLVTANKHATPAHVRPSDIGQLGVASTFALGAHLIEGRQRMLRDAGVLVQGDGRANLVRVNYTAYLRRVRAIGDGYVVVSGIDGIGTTSFSAASVMCRRRGADMIPCTVQRLLCVNAVNGTVEPIVGDIRSSLESLQI